MKSTASFLVALVVFAFLSVGAAAAGFASIFGAMNGGMVERDTARVRLMAMSSDELQRFMLEAKKHLALKDRSEVVRAFDVIRRRSDFDSALAAQMKETLKFVVEKGDVPDILEERLQLLLDAKTGALTSAKVSAELNFAAQIEIPSARRLARVTALTDAMQSISQNPSLAQLEILLQNDVYEIRMHAVDWFRLTPPADFEERGRFLKTAFASKILQVRERAYRTVASWPVADVRALKTAGDVLPLKCGADTSTIIRNACREIRTKAATP